MSTFVENSNRIVAAADGLTQAIINKSGEIDAATEANTNNANAAIQSLADARTVFDADAQAIADKKTQADMDAATIATKKAEAEGNAAAVASVIADVQNLRDEWPSVNLVSTTAFKLSNQSWPGFTYANDGFGTGADNWNYTEEFINLNDTTNQVVNDLRAVTALGPMADHQGDFYVRKITLTKIGANSFSTGIAFANKPHQMSGGYMRKLPGGAWEMFVDTPVNGKRNFDWGAYTGIGNYALNDEIYMALPFVVMGVPATIPLTQSLATSM